MYLKKICCQLYFTSIFSEATLVIFSHFISEQISSYTPDAITLQDGQTHALVNLSSLNNSYCLVAQPFSESSMVPGHCSVTLDRTTRAVQGRWSVTLGIPGRVTEIHVDANVSVQGEICTRFDSFYDKYFVTKPTYYNIITIV